MLLTKVEERRTHLEYVAFVRISKEVCACECDVVFVICMIMIDTIVAWNTLVSCGTYIDQNCQSLTRMHLLFEFLARSLKSFHYTKI